MGKKPIIKYLALCDNRHDMPSAVTGSIFPRNVRNPADLLGMRTWIESALKDTDVLNLFVTGLTVATVEVINYCLENDIKIVLWHFNPDTGAYFQQDVYAPGKRARKNSEFNNCNYEFEKALARPDIPVELSGNIVRKVIMLQDISHINFNNVRFTDCQFSGIGRKVRMLGCEFTNCRGVVQMKNSRLVKCSLHGANKELRFSFKNCNLTGTDVTVDMYHSGLVQLDNCTGPNMALLTRADAMLDHCEK